MIPIDGRGPAPRSWFDHLKALPKRISRHNVTVAAAGIAFYGLLALVPTLVATVSIFGLVNQGDEDEIRTQIEDAAGSLDESTKEFVTDQLAAITTSDGNLLALLLSVALALFSSSGAVQKLMTTIAVAYEVSETRPGWQMRILAYGLTAAAIVSVVLMVFLVGVLPEVLERVDLSEGVTTLINVIRLPAFGLFFVLALTILYRVAPDRSPKTPWRNPGAWVATGLWLLFALAFSLYSSNVGAMPASYGLLGTVAALMIFLQLTAIAVIVGAEYNAEREDALAEAATTFAGATAALAADERSGEGADDIEAPPKLRVVETLPLGKAVAGLVALVLLGRGGRG
ncbi:MAG: YihY/virulence factor BrkB family protein [Actinomycetota bacterium]